MLHADKQDGLAWNVICIHTCTCICVISIVGARSKKLSLDNAQRGAILSDITNRVVSFIL